MQSLELRFFCMPPFLFTYQLDLALQPCNIWGFPFGGKANRIAEEAIRIREGVSHHWFGCRYLPWAPWQVKIKKRFFFCCFVMNFLWIIDRHLNFPQLSVKLVMNAFWVLQKFWCPEFSFKSFMIFSPSWSSPIACHAGG